MMPSGGAQAYCLLACGGACARVGEEGRGGKHATFLSLSFLLSYINWRREAKPA